ncbi:hypothetical protein [Bradyrhizobium sp. AZCC 1678]|uniref:hypothetical protein n=1 Tax=Bradyrhizobium sp. AZCC 1678 TaxID=3117030 RepID=UPI002FEFBF97
MISSEPAAIDSEVERPWIAPPPDAPIASAGKKSEASSDDPTLMRPIFFASRKPFEPPPQRATPPAPTARPPPIEPTLVVGGIVLTAKARRAYLRRPAEADGRWHETGQVIDGWTVAEIDRTGIVLEQADRRFSIQLYPTDLRAFRLERPSPRSRSLR